MLVAAVSATTVLLVACNKQAAETTGTPQVSNAPDYTYGTTLTFGEGGNGDPMKVSGWQKAEPEFTWSDGNLAVIAVKTAALDADVTLTARLAGMIKAPDLPAQQVQVFVNNNKVGEWRVGNTAPFTATIPRDLAKAGGIMAIAFKMPQATSPKALGVSNDERILGVRIYDLQLRKSG